MDRELDESMVGKYMYERKIEHYIGGGTTIMGGDGYRRGMQISRNPKIETSYIDVDAYKTIMESQDTGLIIESVIHFPELFQYVEESMQKDERFLKELVRNKPELIKIISPKLDCYYECVRIACAYHGPYTYGSAQYVRLIPTDLDNC